MNIEKNITAGGTHTRRPDRRGSGRTYTRRRQFHKGLGGRNASPARLYAEPHIQSIRAHPGSIDTLKTEPAAASMLDKALADPALIRSTITAYLCPCTIDPDAEMFCGGKITDDWPPDEMCERCWRQAARP